MTRNGHCKSDILPIWRGSAGIILGDIDITESFQNMYPEIIEGYSGARLYAAAIGTSIMRLFTQKGPTADSRVRLALSMTIDRRLQWRKSRRYR